MNDAFLFVFGLVATILAVGPLAYVAYLDYKEKE